jgi:glycosyltransferase involved in cell wall biosynthesis
MYNSCSFNAVTDKLIKDKIIFIAHSWSDVSLNLQSKALALALSKNNEVLFLNAKKYGQSGTAINNNLTIYEWPGKRPTGWKDLLFAVKLMWYNKPDIVVTNFAANDIMLFVSWFFRVEIRVCYFHTLVQQYIADGNVLEIKQRVNIFRKGLVFRMATHMLPSTKAAKDDLIKFYKVKTNRVFVFPNALPDTEMRNKNDGKKIGFLGRLDRSKGVDILINAFKRLTQKISDTELEIVGKGAREKELKNQVESLGLCDKVLFKGAISYNEVLHFLTRINFLVVPSRMDNLPTVALEALSVGTPVIGSNAGGIPDIIIPGYNGLLFESENDEDLFYKMKHLLYKKDERDIMSVNARKTFEEKYSMTEHAARFEKLLRETHAL